MGFQLPALPNFQTNIPQMPDALSQYGKLLSLKNMQSEQALRQQLAPLDVQEAQARARTATAQAGMTEAEAASQQAMMAAWSDPEFTKKLTGTDAANSSGLGFDPNALTSELTSRGVLPKDALALTNQFVERSQKMATTAKDIAQTGEANAATAAKGYKMMGDKIGGILDMPADKAVQALATLKQDLVKNPKLFPGVPQQDLAHLFSADLEHLPAMASVIGLDSQIAEFHKSKLEAQKTQQGIIPEGGGLSPEAQQKVKTDVEVATNPEIQKGKVAVATAEGQARANIEAQMARGSNAAVAKVPPHLVAPAIADYNKLGDEYAAAQGAANDMKTFIDMARAGNKLAYSYAPTEGVLTFNTGRGVKRVNMPEIESYGGAGSTADRIKGWLGKHVSGASIDASVLNDMESLHGAIANNAKDLYGKKVAVLNQSYGSEFKPAEFSPAKQTANVPSVQIPANVTKALSGVGAGRHTLSDGSVWDKHVDGTVVKAP